ncbi:MAG: class I SAM-dependent methyltransferase [Thermomicrobiales bacterium]
MSDPSATASWLADAARTWDERADWWDTMSAENAASTDRRRELDRWQAALALRPGCRLLDAGCGSGHFSIAWARRGCEVTGIDLSREMLAHAAQNVSDSGVAVQLINSALAPLPLQTAAFDAVFCRTVIHLVPEPLAVLNEFRRVLRPSGRLYASVPGARSPIYANVWRRHLSPGPRPINDMVPWELEALLDSTGWRILDQWGDWSGQNGTAQEVPGSIARQSGNVLLMQTTATTWGFVATTA